jgi:phosphoenolpyruvate synthase/pyruvate phosphate dikinase
MTPTTTGRKQQDGRMTREEYRGVYLRSEHWRETRLAALERAEHRCQLCNGARRLDVHHRTYERLGAERPADLTVLCRMCHDLFHERRKVQPEPRLTKAQRKAARKKAAKAQPAAIYVSPVDKERYSQMMAAERVRRREVKREHAERRREVEQRRIASAKTRDWRDEQELPRK